VNSRQKAQTPDHKRLTELCKGQKCLVCGTSPCEPCHLVHRGMGGGKAGWSIEEIVPLCRKHHDELDARNGVSPAQSEQTRITRYIVKAKARDWQRANS
jgi:hypothetical protein